MENRSVNRDTYFETERVLRRYFMPCGIKTHGKASNRGIFCDPCVPRALRTTRLGGAGSDSPSLAHSRLRQPFKVSPNCNFKRSFTYKEVVTKLRQLILHKCTVICKFGRAVVCGSLFGGLSALIPAQPEPKMFSKILLGFCLQSQLDDSHRNKTTENPAKPHLVFNPDSHCLPR